MTIHNGTLPSALALEDKSVCSSSHSRHPNTIAITTSTSTEVLVWLRLMNSYDFDMWKASLIEGCESGPPEHPSIYRENLEFRANLDNHDEYSEAAADADNNDDVEYVVRPNQRELELLSIQELQSLMEDREISIQGCIDREDMIEKLITHNKSSTKVAHLSRDHTSIPNLIDSIENEAQKFVVHLEVQSSLLARELIDPKSREGKQYHKKVYNDLDSINCFVPLPSDHRINVHPSLHWENRATELALVLATGVPVNIPVLPDHTWFIIDSSWYRHWSIFVSSHRRMASPGPIDNLWMLNPRTSRPFSQLTEETDTKKGDFRRVTPKIWFMFEEWYGGGPRIFTTGPPIEDSKRWKVEHLNCPKYIRQEPVRYKDSSVKVVVESVFEEFEEFESGYDKNPFETAFTPAEDSDENFVGSEQILENLENQELTRTARSPKKIINVANNSPFVPKDKAHPLIHEISETLASVSLNEVIASPSEAIEQERTPFETANEMITIDINTDKGDTGIRRRFTQLWEELLVDDLNVDLGQSPSTLKDDKFPIEEISSENASPVVVASPSFYYGDVYHNEVLSQSFNTAYFAPPGGTSTTSLYTKQVSSVNSYNPFDDEDGILSYSPLGTSTDDVTVIVKQQHSSDFTEVQTLSHDSSTSPTTDGISNESAPIDIDVLNSSANAGLMIYSTEDQLQQRHNEKSITEASTLSSLHYSQIVEHEKLINSLRTEIDMLKKSANIYVDNLSSNGELDSCKINRESLISTLDQDAKADTNSGSSDDSFSSIDDLNYLNHSQPSQYVVSEVLAQESAEGSQVFMSPHDIDEDSIENRTLLYASVTTDKNTSYSQYFSDTSQDVFSPDFVHKKVRNTIPPRAKKDFLPLHVLPFASNFKKPT